LLQVAEAALDHIAALVVGRVEGRRPAAAGAAALPVPDLVGRLRDDGLDAPGPQMLADAREE
jgi:hypothetical protein